MKNIIYIVLPLLLLTAACKTKNKLPRISRAALEKSNKERLSSIKQAELNFTSLAIKAKAELNIGGNRNDVTVNFRILKDQKIWVSLTALAGLEVSRILITPDSIQIINRLDNTYISKPFSFVHTYTNERISFSTLQAILLGNPMAEVYDRGYSFELTDDGLWLSNQTGSLNYQLLFNPAFKMKSALLADADKLQQLQVSYGDFYAEPDSSSMLPHQIKFKSVVGKKSFEADLKYTKIEKDVVLDFPFNVPKRFSVKN